MGDNIDKNDKASPQRHDHHRGQSLHHFHGLLCGTESISHCFQMLPQPKQKLTRVSLIPSVTDVEAIKEEIAVLVSR